MRSKWYALVAFISVIGGASSSNAQMEKKMEAFNLQPSAFARPANAPSCVTAATLHGDAKQGPASMMFKMPQGCVVPWHWHSANEQMIMVSGSAKFEGKNHEPIVVKQGGYIYAPANEIHRFTCLGSCMVARTLDKAYDMHFVDSAGKEISLEAALKLSR